MRHNRDEGGAMATNDTTCSIHPYFKINEGKLAEFKAVAERMVAETGTEPGCLYYGFTYDGDEAYCREAYVDAEGLLAHVAHVGPLLEEALALSELVKMEIHGPADEIDKLREPMAPLGAHFYVLECGFCR